MKFKNNSVKITNNTDRKKIMYRSPVFKKLQIDQTKSGKHDAYEHGNHQPGGASGTGS